MKWLERYHEKVVLPVIAYAELALVFLRKYESTDRLDRILRFADVRIERMEHRHAHATARIASEIKNCAWKTQFRDYSIAAHAIEPPTLLVTKDKRNFAFLAPRAWDPYDLMSTFGVD